VVKDEASDMTDGFGAKRRATVIGSARANDDHISIPGGGAIDNFALRASFALQCLYLYSLKLREVAFAFFKNILAGILLGLSHLCMAQGAGQTRTERAVAPHLYVVLWPNISDIEQSYG
jgi:hypothetical protein